MVMPLSFAAAAPSRMSLFGYSDVVYRSAYAEMDYISEVSSFSNFLYLDVSNIVTPGMSDVQRQQKISGVLDAARSRGLKVILNVSYYFFEPDAAYKTRPAYRLAGCFSGSSVCPRWQTDSNLLKSMQADILAFSVADRPNYYLIGKNDQKTAIDKLHSAFPGIPVMANYVLDGRLDSNKKCVVTNFYDDVPLMRVYGGNREDCVAYDSAYGVPDNIDWLSLQVMNLGVKDLVAKYWTEPIKTMAAAYPNRPVLPVIESFSDELNHYGSQMDDFKTYGFGKRRADSETIGWYYDAAKNDLSGLNVIGFLYHSYGGLNLGQPTRGDGALLAKEKEIFANQSVLPVIKSFYAEPAAIQPNTSSVLRWEVAGATQVAIDHGVGAVKASGNIVNPTDTTTYTLSASNNHGTSTRSVTVTVLGSGNQEQPGGQGQIQPHKDGSLINDSGTIYVLENGLKRPIASMRVFSNMGYKLGNVVKANIPAIKAGEPLLHENQRHPRGSLVVWDKTVYFMGSALRYPFTSGEVFVSWGCSFKDVIPANQHDLALPVGPPVDKKQ